VPVALLFLAVFLLVLYLNAEIRFTEKKVQGLNAIKMAHEDIIQLQRIRGLSEIAAQSGKAERQDIQSLQKQFITDISTPQWRNHGIQFEVAGEMARLQMDATKLFSIPPDANPKADQFQQYTQIIHGLYRIIQLIADRSYLIQAAELDSYYMVDLVINQLPKLMESIGKVRGIGSGILAKGNISNEEKILFGEHMTACTRSFQDIEENIDIILSTAPQLQETIAPLTNDAAMELQHFIAQSQLLLDNKFNLLGPDHYFHDGTFVIDAFRDSHRKITNILSTRLDARLKSQQNLRSNTILLTSFGAILIIYFISSFYRTNRAAFRTIERLSISDHLTDLYNRRYLHEIFPQELRRSQREMKSLTLGMLDIDNFKAYNDIYGHPEGDIILRKIADTLKDALRRAGDFVFRIGGEEFCFLITAMAKDDVKLLMEQIRLRVMALEIEHEGNDAAPFVTISAGAAYLDKVTDEDMGEIMKCADLALYKAKDMGRNCWHFEEIVAAPCGDIEKSSDTGMDHDWQI